MALIIAALAVLAAYGVLAGRRVTGAPGEDVTLPPFID